MSSENPACFGKLPFNLLERLQVGDPGRYWLDAVEVSAGHSCVTSIDTVTLVSGSLPESIAIGILHAMNDIFAANALPLWFSLSMMLPLEADVDVLSRINTAIFDLAQLTTCDVGKLHTTRTDQRPNVTVCVGGARTAMPSRAPYRGFVVLFGNNDSLHYSIDALAPAIALRNKLSREIRGPKKDASGDGLAGALFQICLREAVSIELWASGLRQLAPPFELEDSTKNFLDYASALESDYAALFRRQLFSPRVFGPIVCLIDEQAAFDRSNSLIIGTFEQGQPKLGISDK